MTEPIRLHLFKTLLVGIIIVVPFAITLFVLEALLKFSDTFLFRLLPKGLQPDHLFGFHIPGLGILFSLLIVYLAGVVGRNYLGKRVIEGAESFLKEIPVIRGIYFASRKLMETLVEGPSEKRFKRVVFLPFPRSGIYMLGFVTAEIEAQGEGERQLIVFIPTSPNPTSGFVCFCRESDVIFTDIPLEDAIQFVLSFGFSSSEPIQRYSKEKILFLPRTEKAGSSPLRMG